MTQSDSKPDEKRHNESDRRAPEGRRAVDRDLPEDGALEDVSVPDQRRRKEVRRSGDDRRHSQ